MTEKIKMQIKKVRECGETNMLDSYGVQKVAFKKGFYELVNLIEENRHIYQKFILFNEK